MTSDRVGIPFAIFVSLVSFAIRAVRVSVRYAATFSRGGPSATA